MKIEHKCCRNLGIETSEGPKHMEFIYLVLEEGEEIKDVSYEGDRTLVISYTEGKFKL